MYSTKVSVKGLRVGLKDMGLRTISDKGSHKVLIKHPPHKSRTRGTPRGGEQNRVLTVDPSPDSESPREVGVVDSVVGSL